MKNTLIIILFFFTLSVYGQSRRNDASLDAAIQNSAIQIQDDLSRSSTIIVYQFKSQNAEVSNYVLAELFHLLVSSRQFTVLDRTAQEVVDAELHFQFVTSEGMISDDSLASITRRIGAQAIVTGSLDDMGDKYRFRIRVIGTETIQAIVSFVGDVNKNDHRIATLLKLNRMPVIYPFVPGMAQIFKGSNFKGISFIVGISAFSCGIVATEVFRADNASKIHTTFNVAQRQVYIDNANNLQNARNILIAGTTVLYVWNIIDGFVAKRPGHNLAQTDSTGFNISPYIDSHSGSGGFLLTLNF